MYPVCAALSACLAQAIFSVIHMWLYQREAYVFPNSATLLDSLPCMNAGILLSILCRSKSEGHPMYLIYVPLFKGVTGTHRRFYSRRVRWHRLARSSAMPAAGAAERVHGEYRLKGMIGGRWLRECSRMQSNGARREYRANSAALQGIRKARGYAALACPLECSGRGYTQAGAAAVYCFIAELEKLKCSAVARMLQEMWLKFYDKKPIIYR
jgi:hypothetical protein